MRPRLFLAAGWAQAAEAMMPLGRTLGDLEFSVHAESDPPLRFDAPCVAVGWSLGGMRLLEMAATAGKNVSGLVLIGSTARFCLAQDYPTGVPAATVQRMRQRLARQRGLVLDGFARLLFEPDPVPAGFVADVGQAETVLQDGLRYLQETDLRPALAHVRIPVLILHGRQDRVVPVGAAEYLAGSLSSATLQVLDVGGHCLPLTRPEVLGTAIRTWMGRVL
ncbi:MAG: alpha/beta fold hydrolase [Pirellulaceae bacterium]